MTNQSRVIDSMMIDLCLTQYDWACLWKHKGTIKFNAELDLSGNIPFFVMISNEKMFDIRAPRDNIFIVSDSIYTFDKGYYDLM